MLEILQHWFPVYFPPIFHSTFYFPLDFLILNRYFSSDTEVNVDNCEKWLPLIQLVSLIKKEDPIAAVEYFCMSAVKNSVNERKNVVEETGVWHLTETNDRFLQSVRFHYFTLHFNFLTNFNLPGPAIGQSHANET